MPEQLNVQSVKKMEAELADRKAALKTSIIGLIEGHLAELNQLGFSYSLVENGHKKIGRPRKDSVNGKEANQTAGR